jgi:hypothetical protein
MGKLVSALVRFDLPLVIVSPWDRESGWTEKGLES